MEVKDIYTDFIRGLCASESLAMSNTNFKVSFKCLLFIIPRDAILVYTDAQIEGWKQVRVDVLN
jgi:hypothetical protein